MAEDVSGAKTTPLFPQHLALGGRMVEFAGYSMPLHYPAGIIAEHHWTRTHAGLFDVSHMGPAFLMLSAHSGDPEADHRSVSALIEPLIAGDIAGLKPGKLRYTLLLNDDGGIRDDLMVGRHPDPEWAGTLYVVVNAGTKDADFAALEAAAGDRAALKRADDCGLFALQGPEAAAVIAEIVPAAAALGFMEFANLPWGDTVLVVSRSGYTGEDGFEILVEPTHAVRLWETLLRDPRVRPIGLGARDSLRLEAGLPLYGHDLDETTSPVEAGLDFALSKRRREAADFPGAARILAEKADGPGRIRVGLRVTGAPAREGAEVLDIGSVSVGRVSSGGFSPSLNAPIALAYVPPALAAPGTELQVLVRGRTQPATVAALPFVPHRYHRKPSA